MEPLTIFSLSLAILNIFLNTIASIYDKVDQILTYKEKLKRFQRTLHDCSISFQLWRSIWEQKGVDEITYRRLFSKDGWEAIKSSKGFIEHHLEALRGELCLTVKPSKGADAALETDSQISGMLPSVTKRMRIRMLAIFQTKARKPAGEAPAGEAPVAEIAVTETPEGLQPQEFQTWREFTDSLVFIDPQPTPDPSLIRRIIGILGPNQRLDKRFADLKEGVDQLHRLSTNYYRHMGYGKEQPKHMEDVEPVMEKFNFWEVASTFSTNVLRHGDGIPDSGWYLQLHFPIDITDCNELLTDTVSNCNFWFATNTKPQHGPIFAREVKLLQLKGALEPMNEIETQLTDALTTLYTDGECDFAMPSSKYYQLKAFEEPALWTKNWRTLLAAGVDDPEVRKSFELERARLAFGFTVWMILLWESDWFTHICSCSFRSVHFTERRLRDGDGRGQADIRQENIYLAVKGFSEEPTGEKDAPAANEGLNPAPDTGAQADEQTCPRRSAPSDKLFLFGILLAELLLGEPVDLDEKNQVKGKWTNLRSLLWELEKVPGVFGAVKFCFDNARDKRWIKAGSGLTLGQKEKLIEKVLKPIKTYYTVFKDKDPYVGETFNITHHEDNNLSFQDALG